MKWKPYPTYKPSGVESLGAQPAHWEVRPLMRLIDTDRPIMYGIVLPGPDVDDGVPIVKGGDIKPGRLALDRLCRTTFEIEASYARSRLKGGDIVFSIRGTVGETELVPDEIAGANLTQDAARVAPGRGVDAVWLIFVLKAQGVTEPLLSLSLGAAVRGVNIRDLKRLRVPVPPAREQRAIGHFLRAATARLDALVAKKRALVERLREKRTAIISRTVTRGLPPEAARAAGLAPHPNLKPSGIPWLGDIPEHWRVTRLKRIADVRQGVTKGRDLGGQETVEVPYLRVANVQDGYIDLSDVATIAVLPSEVPRFSLAKGDVLMNEGGDNDKLGRGAVWNGDIAPCLHQNHVFAVRPHDVATGAWIARWGKGGAAKAYLFLSGNQTTNLASISSNSIREMPLCLPPAAEQQAIAEYLGRETARIDRLVEKVQAAIERLQEYRQALITAAVTGKIDVRVGARACGGAA